VSTSKNDGNSSNLLGTIPISSIMTGSKDSQRRPKSLWGL